MKIGQLTDISGFVRQRIFEICRHYLRQNGLTKSLVLVGNGKFPNFKEEINVL